VAESLLTKKIIEGKILAAASRKLEKIIRYEI
jgi:hypothetical protein